jgi:EmrB/QacA subfamily drug resistance transporter
MHGAPVSLKQPCDEGVVLGAPSPEGAPASARPWILLVTILGSSLAFVDGTVVNVALPALQRGLDATVADVQWVVEAYALFFSALLLVGGSLGDRFGRRRLYAIGMAVFAGASALCGLAGSIRLLVLARAIQGIGAALLVPGSLAIIAASFPEKERGRAIGAWSGWSAMTTAVGPVLGGWLIDHAGWRSAFFVNPPIALTALLLLFWRVPESRDPSAAKQLDWIGAGLATLGLGGLVFGLIESSRRGFRDPAVLTALAVGAASVVAFVVAEAKSRAPMLPLSLFRSRAFAGANLLTAGLYGALAMALFVLPLDLIQVQGYSATAAGAAILPLIAIVFLLSRWSGGLLDRVGARLPLVAGPAIAACGLALLAWPGIGGSYWSTFFPALVVLGIGMAVTVAPLTTTVMNAVDVAHAGIASGVNNAVSRAAGLISIAVMGVLLQHVFDAQLEWRIAGLGLRLEVVVELRAERTLLANATPPASASPSDRAAIQRAIAEAFVAGVRLVALTAAGLALASAVVGAVTIDPLASKRHARVN